MLKLKLTLWETEEEIKKLSLGNAAAAGGDPVSLPLLPGEFGVDGEAALVCMHGSGHGHGHGHVDLQYWADTFSG